MTFREAPPHHVGHTKGFHSQQVEDHSVGQSELGLENGRFTLQHAEETVLDNAELKLKVKKNQATDHF